MTIKDSGLRIRVQRDLRERFVDACRAHDKPAAQVIREFMRGYVEQHAPPGRGKFARKRGNQGPTHDD